MERSWLQQQASLSKFDGYRDSEPFSKVKVTATPAPTAYSGSAAVPEAGRNGDVVFAPEEAAADWSGFAPRNCPGRRMHHGGLPAAHRETIARSEEHGIVPAADTVTEDSLKTRRRVIAEPARAGEGLVLGGPEAPEPEERFTTAARAANARESTPLEMKSDGSGGRYQKNAGKKHITPPYERTSAMMPGAARPRGGGVGGGGGGYGRQAGQEGGDIMWANRAPLGDPLLIQQQQQQQQQQPDFTPHCAEKSQELFGSKGRAAALNGPGSFLKGMGCQMAGSGAGGGGGGGVGFSPPGSRRERNVDGGGGDGGAERGGAGEGPGRRREDGPLTKELYAANYNPYISGYTGHQPRR